MHNHKRQKQLLECFVKTFDVDECNEICMENLRMKCNIVIYRIQVKFSNKSKMQFPGKKEAKDRQKKLCFALI